MELRNELEVLQQKTVPELYKALKAAEKSRRVDKTKQIVLISCVLKKPLYAQVALWDKIRKKDIDGLKSLLKQFNATFSLAGNSFLEIILDYFEGEKVSSEFVDALYYSSIDTQILKHIKKETATKFSDLLERFGYSTRKQDLYIKIAELQKK